MNTTVFVHIDEDAPIKAAQQSDCETLHVGHISGLTLFFSDQLSTGKLREIADELTVLTERINARIDEKFQAPDRPWLDDDRNVRMP